MGLNTKEDTSNIVKSNGENSQAHITYCNALSNSGLSNESQQLKVSGLRNIIHNDSIKVMDINKLNRSENALTEELNVSTKPSNVKSDDNNANFIIKNIVEMNNADERCSNTNLLLRNELDFNKKADQDNAMPCISDSLKESCKCDELLLPVAYHNTSQNILVIDCVQSNTLTETENIKHKQEGGNTETNTEIESSEHEQQSDITQTESSKNEHEGDITETESSKHEHEGDITETESSKHEHEDDITETESSKHEQESDITQTENSKHEQESDITPTENSKHEQESDITPTENSKHEQESDITPTENSKHEQERDIPQTKVNKPEHERDITESDSTEHDQEYGPTEATESVNSLMKADINDSKISADINSSTNTSKTYFQHSDGDLKNTSAEDACNRVSDSKLLTTDVEEGDLECLICGEIQDTSHLQTTQNCQTANNSSTNTPCKIHLVCEQCRDDCILKDPSNDDEKDQIVKCPFC